MQEQSTCNWHDYLFETRLQCLHPSQRSPAARSVAQSERDADIQDCSRCNALAASAAQACHIHFSELLLVRCACSPSHCLWEVPERRERFVADDIQLRCSEPATKWRYARNVRRSLYS